MKNKLPFRQFRALEGVPVFFSGQIGLKDGRLIDGAPFEFANQFQAAAENVGNALRNAGLRLSDLVHITIILSDMDYFDSLNWCYEKWLKDINPKPARCCFAASALPLGADVEIVAIASKTRKEGV